MNPIRPNFPLPVAQPRPVRPEARAAQRAFFQAAEPMAAARATAAPSSSMPVTATIPIERLRRDGGEPPQRYMRPGSLVDIKV